MERCMTLVIAIILAGAGEDAPRIASLTGPFSNPAAPSKAPSLRRS
jgi:hypothetical protein